MYGYDYEEDQTDAEWIAAEEKHLAEVYGGNFIRVKCDVNRTDYYCELCLAEMNGKKSLQAHCSGMKHLKKQDQWMKKNKPDEFDHGLGGGATGYSDRDRSPLRRTYQDNYERGPDDSHTSYVAPPARLSGSSTGMLLEKLADCCIKNEKDADLALNVVASLFKALKNYFIDIEDDNLSMLLMEAEVKVGTTKALKVGRNITRSHLRGSPDPCSSSSLQ